MEAAKRKKGIIWLLIVSLLFGGIAIPGQVKAAETYMVFFDSEGGSLCNYITDIPENSRISLPTPEKEGYIFAGWYKDSDCTASQVFTQYTPVTENMLLYAKWQEKPIKEIVAEYIGDPIVINNVVDKEDLVVTIHYTDGTTKVVEEEDFELENALIQTTGNNFVIVRCKNRTDYIWIKGIKEPIYCIGFDTMGGSAVAPITGIAPDAYVQLPEEPTKEGYVFAGWYMEKTYETKFDAKKPITKTFIVYAKWVKEEEAEEEVLKEEVLALNLTQANLNINATESIFVKTLNQYLEVYYESSNDEIVEVDKNGIITGLEDGRATINVYVEDGSVFKCKVGVGTEQYITKIETNVKAKQIKKGKTYRIKTTITPKAVPQEKISYTSSNKSIATVSSNGVVKAKKKGVCYITVKTKDGTNLQKKVKIRVV